MLHEVESRGAKAKSANAARTSNELKPINELTRRSQGGGADFAQRSQHLDFPSGAKDVAVTAVSRQVTDTPSAGGGVPAPGFEPAPAVTPLHKVRSSFAPAKHGPRCIRERRGGARGDDRACEGVVDGGAPPRAAAPGRRLAPAEVRATLLRASERRAPACAGAHAACPAVRSERRAPARAAARAGCLGRRAAAGVWRAAACVQWAAAGVRQQPASARTTFTRAAWPGRAMTATRLHCGSRARRAGGGVRRGRASEAGSDWSLGVPLTRRGRMRAGRPRRTQTAPSGLRGPGPRTRSRATATVDSSVSAGIGRAAT